MSKTDFCRVPRCLRAVLARGLCTAHYFRFRRTGSVLGKRENLEVGPRIYEIEDDSKAHLIYEAIQTDSVTK